MTNIISDPFYFLAPLFAGAIVLLLLVMAMVWSRRDFTAGLFTVFLVSIAVHNFLFFGMRLSPDIYHALLWERAMCVPALATFVLYYHFTLVYINTGGQRRILRASYLLLAVVAALAPTNLVIQGMRVEDYGYAPVVGPASYAWFGVGPLLILGGAYNLIRYYRNSASSEERKGAIILALAVVFPLTGLILDGFSNLPPAFIWGNLMFSILCTVAVLKYHLLDITIFVRKSLVYLLVSAVVAIPYVATLVSVNLFFKPAIEAWWIHAVLILLLAIILRPLYGWAQRMVDRLFYRDRYDYLRALEQFSRETQSITSYRELSSTLVKLVGGALGSSTAYLLLRSEDNHGFTMVACAGLDNPPSGIALGDRSLLVEWLKLHGRIVSSQELNGVPELQSLSLREKDNLEEMEAKLYVPVQTSLGQLSGILVLGQKLSRQTYSSQDRQLLTALSSQMAITLENARLYEEARQSEERIRVAEQNFRNSMEDSPLGIRVVTRQGELLYANKAILDILGCDSIEELKPIPISRFYIPESRAEHRERREKRSQGQPVPSPYEIGIVRKDGEVRHLLAFRKEVIWDGKKQFQVVYQDITQQKQAIEALRQSEEKYSTLVEQSNDGIAVIQDGLIRFSNPKMLKICGLTAETSGEVLGKPFLDFVSPEYRDSVADRYKKRMSGEEVPNTCELEVLAKDGSKRFVEINVSRIEYQRRPADIIIARDISERKRAEEREKQLQQELNLSRRLASIGELVAGVAHEINNPLTGITGFSERLLRRSTDEETREELQLIHDEAERAATVVQNLLTFARRQQQKKETTDINDIVQRALELRAYELKTSNIEVVTDLAPNLCKILANYQQIQQVFLNIIVNAEQAMSEANRGGKLHIKTEKAIDYVRVSISDDGPGIPAEHLDKLFNPFFTTRGERGGSGLGLSVCHGIVTEHGGRIYARSKPGKGATFVVELPMANEKMDKSKDG